VPGPWKILMVIGTRPNMVKAAPVLAELARRPERFASVLVHTGQHYDADMSDVFLEELGIGEPDHCLGVGSGTHAEQVGRVLERLDPVLKEEAPELALVVGDVNSTLAAALGAAQRAVPVGHIEAGLRSFDPTMIEELNRVVTDAVSSLLFVHSPEAVENLVREGIPEPAIHYVGNTMIDTLLSLRNHAESRSAPERHELREGEYLLVTLHRPALVDGPLLGAAVEQLAAVADDMPVVFPVHPHTRAALDGRIGKPDAIRFLPPLGYLDFLGLMAGAAGVLTDSGGVQEETTILGVPCFTLRETTERPVTVEHGTNTVLGLAPDRIADVPGLLRKADAQPRQPPMWDGRAAERIVDALEVFLEQDPRPVRFAPTPSGRPGRAPGSGGR
jgi:UDP-N-acetylglucosamine 2-epimerase (non-hydrolysing)